MLTKSTEAKTQTELTLSEENVEVDVGTDARPSSRLVFPPISRILRDPNLPKANVNPAESIDHSHSGIESELERLLTRFDEFQDSEVYLTRVSRLAAACGRFDTACDLANQAIDINADNPNLRYRLADILLRSENYGHAEPILTSLARSKHLLSCIRLIELTIRRADFDSADQWLQKAADIDEYDWRVQMIAGTLALVTGRSARAVRHFRNALEHRPRSVRLHHNLALAHVLSGHSENAITCFRKAIALNPFNRPTLTAWADLSVHLRKGLPHVGRALSRYLNIDPDDKPTIGRLAYILREEGDCRASYRLLSRFRHHSPDPTIINNLGVLAAEQRNLSQAVADFSKAVSLVVHPKTNSEIRLRSFATSNLVAALIESRSFVEAEALARAFISDVDLGQTLKVEPDYRVADALVESLMETGQFEEAVKLAEHWLELPELHERLESSLSNKLVCYFTLESTDNQRAYTYAMRAYEIQCRIQPKDHARRNAALNNLAYAAIELGEYEAAAEYLARLQSVADGSGAFCFATRGLFAIRMGDISKGERLYQRAISLVDGSFRKQFQKKLQWELGVYWYDHGNTKKAKLHLTRVLKTDTDSIWTLRNLDKQARALLHG